MSVFQRYHPRLQQAIVSRLGWRELRAVQELASEAVLEGCNALVLAPTAGGKTEASMFPVLSSLLEDPPENLAVLYIAPIKALLNNQSERLETYFQMVGLERTVWHGDVDASEKRRFVKNPTALLMTTPESLEVILTSPKSGAVRLFRDLRFVVIDEIHALAGVDRGTHLLSVLERIQLYSKHDIQRIGLSATVGNPEQILRWLQGSSKRPGRLVDPPRPKSQRDLRITYLPSTLQIASAVSAKASGSKSLCFCQSRSLSEEIAETVQRLSIEAFVHHGSISRVQRELAESMFYKGKEALIVCTSTLELGIDVGDLDRVLQINSPSTVSSFLQRMGRTGRRAGQVANTHFFAETSIEALQACAIIELARKGWVEPVPVQSRCWPVLVQQIFATLLQFGTTTREKLWQIFHPVPDFAGIRLEEFRALLEHMLATQFLFESAGVLSMGEAAEKAFGRFNFQKLYSVFSTPEHYTVRTSEGRPIGTLEQVFVDNLLEDVTCFLLSGRPWVALQIEHKERQILVKEAPAGRKPTWQGAPQFLHFELCREMAAILVDGRSLPYADSKALTAIETMRNDWGRHLSSYRWYIESEPQGEVMHTFAGGAVNNTIRHGLGVLKNWTLSSDNFRIRCKERVEPKELSEALATLSKADFWEDDENREKLLLRLPEYRLSKFQPALPRRCVLEMVHSSQIDVARTLKYLNLPAGGPQSTVVGEY